VRFAVYTDYQYRSDGRSVYADKAFAVFLAAVADGLDAMVVVGRLRPERGPGHYRLPASVAFVPLPWYPTLARPAAAAPALLRSLRRFWRVLEEVDGVWILGPHVLGIAFAILATVRGRRVVLGVRQDLPRYTRMRHPGRPVLQLSALLLEAAWRGLARRYPVVAVGPDLERRYRRSRRVLAVSVSLVREGDLATARDADRRTYDGDLRVLSVGRLEREKAPLLIPDILVRLRARDARWTMLVCGEGPLREQLEERISALALDEHVELRGYVPVHDGLLPLYRDSHFLLHVSLTEGLPQVLHEAFATRTPVVATAVGGVAEAAAGCALLVPPGDPEAAAAALERLAADATLRARLVDAAAQRVSGRTIEGEAAAVAAFLSEVGRR
jgi:glycosyltransferase involved in cell wall biosynthesis